MTFDSTAYASTSYEGGEIDGPNIRPSNHKVKASRLIQSTRKETHHDYCEQTEIADWESEGGAHIDHASDISRIDGVTSEGYLAAHITAAQSRMHAGEYDAAYQELRAAADRFIDYKERIHASFEDTISHLSTLGCNASPPHPKALSLIRLQERLTA